MTEQACEFVDNRLRRCPPDRAGAVPYGQAGENALRFPHLAHRSAAAGTCPNKRDHRRFSMLEYDSKTLSVNPQSVSGASPMPNPLCLWSSILTDQGIFEMFRA